MRPNQKEKRVQRTLKKFSGQNLDGFIAEKEIRSSHLACSLNLRIRNSAREVKSKSAMGDQRFLDPSSQSLEPSPFVRPPFAASHKVRSFSSPKFGVPNPVTGSQPLMALKPSVPHPGLFPPTMSFRPLNPSAYNHGLRNPRDGSPAAMREPFRRDTTEARV